MERKKFNKEPFKGIQLDMAPRDKKTVQQHEWEQLTDVLDICKCCDTARWVLGNSIVYYPEWSNGVGELKSTMLESPCITRPTTKNTYTMNKNKELIRHIAERFVREDHTGDSFDKLPNHIKKQKVTLRERFVRQMMQFVYEEFTAAQVSVYNFLDIEVPYDKIHERAVRRGLVQEQEAGKNDQSTNI